MHAVVTKQKLLNKLISQAKSQLKYRLSRKLMTYLNQLVNSNLSAAFTEASFMSLFYIHECSDGLSTCPAKQTASRELTQDWLMSVVMYVTASSDMHTSKQPQLR